MNKPCHLCGRHRRALATCDQIIVTSGVLGQLRHTFTPCTCSRKRFFPVTNIDELKSTGLKATLPRLKILEVFQRGTQRHMTAEDVFRVLLDNRSDIGLATVYRVLMQFEQAGLLTRSNFESGKAVYELNEGHHHDHMVCVDCGRVEEFFDNDIERRQHAIAAEKGFRLQDHALSLYATCIKENCPHRQTGVNGHRHPSPGGGAG